MFVIFHINLILRTFLSLVHTLHVGFDVPFPLLHKLVPIPLLICNTNTVLYVGLFELFLNPNNLTSLKILKILFHVLSTFL